MKINALFCPIRSARRFLSHSVSTLFLAAGLHHGLAADLVWDSLPGNGVPNGGAGSWGVTATNWTTDGGLSNVVWNNDGTNNAIFDGAGGNVVLSTALLVNNLTFSGAGYTITGTNSTTAVDKLIFTSDTSTINVLGDTTIAARIEGTTLTKTGAGTLTFTANSGLTNLILSGGLTIFKTGFDQQDALGPNGILTVNAGATARLGTLGITDTSGSATGVNNFRVQSQFVINGGTIDVQERTDVGLITMTGGTLTGQNAPGIDVSLGRLWIREQGFIINASATTSVISTNNLALAASTTFNVADGAAAVDLLVKSRIMQSYGITKSGAGSMTLAGANLYSGATNLNEGRTTLASTGSLGNTAIRVAPGAVLAAAGGSYAGSLATSILGASLLLQGGSTFDMVDGGAGTFSLNPNSGYTNNALAIEGATLRFDLAPSGTDSVAVTGGGTYTGSNQVDLVPSGAFLLNGVYDLIKASSFSGDGSIAFAGGATTKNVTLGATTYSLELLTTFFGQQVSVTGGFDPLAVAYWKGGSALWNAIGPANWAKDAAGTPASIYPTSITDVVFSVTTGGANLNTTLGENFSINSLRFSAQADAAHAVTIGGPNTLTLGVGGLIVEEGSGAHTIATGGVILATDQVWSNGSTNPLKVTAPISGANLTVDGQGPFVLTGANTYRNTTVNFGASLRIGDGLTAGTLGTGTLTNNGRLTFDRPDNFTLSIVVNGTGEVVKAGAGTMTYTSGGGGQNSPGITSLVLAQGRAIFLTGFDQRDALTTGGVMTVKDGAVAQLGDGTGGAGVNNFNFNQDWVIETGGVVDIRDRSDIGKITLIGGSIIGTTPVGNSGKLFIRTPGFETLPSPITSTISNGHLAPTTADAFPDPVKFVVAEGPAEPDLLVNAAIRQDGTLILGIVKSGDGKMTLASAQNLLTGLTTIAAGTLEMGTGSTLGGGTQNVQLSATLSGVGTVGTVNLDAGGKLAPGLSGIGTLNAAALNFADASILSAEIGATTADSVNVTGAVNLTGLVQLTLGLLADPVDGTTFTLLNSAGGIFGYDFGSRFAYGVTALDEGQAFTVTDGPLSQSFVIHYAADGGTDVTLTAVPEPGSATLLFAGLALLARRRRSSKGSNSGRRTVPASLV
jgi:fibronectin-binding autotransporter adhesin